MLVLISGFTQNWEKKHVFLVFITGKHTETKRPLNKLFHNLHVFENTGENPESNSSDIQQSESLLLEMQFNVVISCCKASALITLPPSGPSVENDWPFHR